jgi:YebC/PmpR family DNA-binding regulatory protein
VSGHSKWATIKRKKGAADAKRGALFSKLSRAITVAAREGGGDPESNATLAGAIEKARANSMPKDNIERAIQKGTGGGADAVDYETVTYEGYGPGGVAIICVALTDNRNRTASDVRHAFTKSGSELGTPGSVAWQFERKGVILIDGAGVDEEALMDAALEAGAEDISEDGSQWQLVTDPTELAQVRGNLEGAGFVMASADITMLPKATVETGEKEARQLLRLLDDLEENDDVQDVYANFDISEEVMEAVAG